MSGRESTVRQSTVRGSTVHDARVRGTTGHETADDAQAALRTWLRLLACTSLVEREVRARLRQHFDTTLPRFDVLAQLDAAARSADGDPMAGALTMSELSERLMVTNGNLTGLVARLVRERLVSRAASPIDRRVQRVRLTASCKRALDAMTPVHRRWIGALFAGLSPEERAQLDTLLGKLKTTVRRTLDDGEELR